MRQDTESGSQTSEATPQPGASSRGHPAIKACSFRLRGPTQRAPGFKPQVGFTLPRAFYMHPVSGAYHLVWSTPRGNEIFDRQCGRRRAGRFFARMHVAHGGADLSMPEFAIRFDPGLRRMGPRVSQISLEKDCRHAQARNN